VRYDDSTGDIIVDVDDSRTAGAGVPGKGVPELSVGRNASFGEYFTGRIDNVFIYNEFLY
jgi:hypothetical protein